MTQTITVCGVETTVTSAYYNWVKWCAGCTPQAYAREAELGKAKRNTPAYHDYWKAYWKNIDKQENAQ